MNNSLSFYGKTELKALHVAQAKRHYEQDMLVAGTYGETVDGVFRGCDIGCFAHDIQPGTDSPHEVVGKDRGLPQWLLRWQDQMFELLPKGKREQFHVDCAEAIPVGVDLTTAQHAASIARMDRLLIRQTGALKAKHAHGVHEAIVQVIAAIEQVRAAHLCGSAYSADSAVSAADSAYSATRSRELMAERKSMLGALRSLGAQP